MLYFSEKLNKAFKTEKECLEAEFKAKEEENRKAILKEREEAELKAKKEAAAAERKEAAAKVDTARKAYLEAQKAYRTELEEFCKTYGTYHYSVENGDEIPSLFDVFGNWLRL